METPTKTPTETPTERTFTRTARRQLLSSEPDPVTPEAEAADVQQRFSPITLPAPTKQVRRTGGWEWTGFHRLLARHIYIDVVKSYKGVAKLATLSWSWVMGADAGPCPPDRMMAQSGIAAWLGAAGQLDYEHETAEIRADLAEHMGSWSADESERYHREQSVLAAHTWCRNTDQPRSNLALVHLSWMFACSHMCMRMLTRSMRCAGVHTGLGLCV